MPGIYLFCKTSVIGDAFYKTVALYAMRGDTIMWQTIIYSAIAGIAGTGIGGFLGSFCLGKSKKIMGIASAFSAGIMNAIVMFQLFPESVKFGGIPLTIVAFLFGVVLVIGITALMKRERFQAKRATYRNANFVRTGLIMCLAIAIHNLPEGLIIGSGEAAGSGIVMAFLLSMHNIPEGAAMTIPLASGGMNPWKAFSYSLLTGAPTVLGGMIGYALGSISDGMIATSLAVAAGAMLYITYADVLKHSWEMTGGGMSSTLSVLCGTLTGMVLCFI